MAIDTDWEESLEDQQVVFTRDAPNWRRIPPRMRAVITGRVDLLRKIRTDIAESAAVGAMPPIQVEDVGWDPRSIGGFVWARVSIATIGDRSVFSCEIPASTLYCIQDEAHLRSIVVHEFAHVFFFQQLAVDSSDGGAQNISLDSEQPNDPDADRKTLVNPADWFAPGDAEDFVFHNDGRFEPATRIFAERWYRAGLPIIPTRLEWPSIQARIAIPSCVIDHVRRMRGALCPSPQ